MRRMLVLLAIAISSSVTTAALLGQRGPAAGEGRGATLPAPTGRTLDDVRRDSMMSRGSQSALSDAPRPPAPRIVEAEVFALTDRLGNVRAELNAGEGGGRMQMYDAKGKVRLEMGEAGGVTTVKLMGKDGRTGLELRLTDGGDARVAVGMQDARSDKAAMWLDVTAAGDGKVILHDLKGEDAVVLETHRDAGGSVEVHKAGIGSGGGYLTPTSMSLLSAENGPRAQLTLHPQGIAQLQMAAGGASKSSVELASVKEASYLTLHTEDFGRADLRTQDNFALLTLKPRGGAGGIEAMTRREDGKTNAHLFLSDIDGLQKLQLNVAGDGRATSRLVGADGRGVPGAAAGSLP